VSAGELNVTEEPACFVNFHMSASTIITLHTTVHSMCLVLASHEFI
jgi:hypothetical protein